MTPTIMAGLACSMGKTPQSREASELALGEKDETRRDSPPGTAKLGELAQTVLLCLEDEILSKSAVVDTCSVVSSEQIGSSPKQQNGPPSIPVRRSSVAPQRTARFKKGSPCMRRQALMNSMYLEIAPAAHQTGHDVVVAVSEAVALLRKGEEGEGPPDTRKKGEGEEKMSKVELWLKESRIVGNTFAVRYRPSIPTLTGLPTAPLALSDRDRGLAVVAEARTKIVPGRHDWATDVETTPSTYPVLGGPNHASPTAGSPGGVRGRRKSEMNWRRIMQERQNPVDGVVEEVAKIDAKKKKRTVTFSMLGRAIKMAVGGSLKREKPPDLNDTTTTTSPSPDTTPSKKRCWTTTINEKYHQIFTRHLKPRPRRHHSSNEDPCSLDLPRRRPHTALGIHDIDRTPYLSDLVPFLPDGEEEQYTPTWIKENLARLFHERSKPPVGQRRPASAPCLDYSPVGAPGGCLDGEMLGMEWAPDGEGCRQRRLGLPGGGGR